MSSSPYPSLLDVWSRASTHALDTMLETNRTMAAAFGVSMTDGDSPLGRTEDRLEPNEALAEWGIERELATEGTLSVGDRVRFTKTLTEADVERFAAASGDTNPMHLDDEWAEETRFAGRIVHGTLVAGLISAALARLPGGIIYLSQDVEFQAPVRLDDRITAEVEVVEALGGDRYRVRTRVVDDGNPVVDGEAVILIDESPEES